MQSAEASERLKAIRELEGTGRADSAVAIPALINCLKDPDAQVRAAAAMAMVPVMSGAGTTETGNNDVHAAVSALREGLKDSQAPTRAVVANALGMIAMTWSGSTGAIDLAEINESLIDSARDRDAEVRMTAIRGLGGISPKVTDAPPNVLVAALEDGSEKIRGEAAQALLHFHRGLPRLIPSLARSVEKAPPRFRPGYLVVLKGIRPPKFTGDAALALAWILGSSDREVRYLAASAFAEFRDGAHAAIPSLIKSLRNEGGSARRDLGAPATPDPVIAAAMALGRVAPPSAMAAESAGALIEVLRSSDPKRRHAAAHELGQFPADPAMISALTESVGDRDETVRAAALQSLDVIGEKTPLTTDPKPVAAALEDESAQVRCMAARAVRHFGPAAAPALASLFRNLREAVADKRTGDAVEFALALGKIAPKDGSFTEAKAVLVAALTSDDGAARSNAAWDIGALGPAATAAVPALIELLKGATDNRDPWGDRKRAARSLGLIARDTPEANQVVTALLASLEKRPDGPGTKEIIEALARFGPKAARAIPLLRSLLNANKVNAVDTELAEKVLAELERAE